MSAVGTALKSRAHDVHPAISIEVRDHRTRWSCSRTQGGCRSETTSSHPFKQAEDFAAIAHAKLDPQYVERAISV